MKIKFNGPVENGNTGVKISYPRLIAISGLLVILTLLLVGCSSYNGSGGYGGNNGGNDSVTTSTVDMENTSYQPDSIEVEVGTEVTWVNQDGIDHTVTGENGQFDSRTIEPGEEFTFTFDEPGTYEYSCTFHPSMEGEVLVNS